MTKQELETSIGLPVLVDEPLKNHTTFRIGGPADFLVEVHAANELEKALRVAVENSLPITIIGGGSNILVNDEGIRGLVIKLSGGEPQIENDLVTVFAGANLMSFIQTCLNSNLGGLEFAGNIPGTIGGAIRGNAGAYGKGVGDFVTEVQAFELVDGVVVSKTFLKDECNFKYRSSIFKEKPNLYIASATFALDQVEDADARLRNIKQEGDDRRAKQPYELPSAGCAFKNCEYDQPDGSYSGWAAHGKLAAGKLIEELDLKGFKIGGAMISEKHANFIVNTGGATASDVIQLISIIKMKVRDKFDIQLQEEVQYVGF